MQDARRFIDRHGFSWQVCELWSAVSAPLPYLGDAPASSRGWLYFFSRGTTLVLREYPAGWEELTWIELEQLRERAQVLGSDTAIRLPRGEQGASASASPSAARHAHPHV
jgi:hypothetical protein